MKIKFASLKDWPDLMDFFEISFKEHNLKNPRFEKIMPDIYSRDTKSVRNNIIARDEKSGKIASGAGLFPIHLKIWGMPYTIQGIGGVGTIPEFRGMNLMNTILPELCCEIRRRGAPFSWLAGHRYRYGRFGWEKAGIVLQYSLWSRNIKAVKNNGFDVSEIEYGKIPWKTLLAARDIGPSTGGNAPLPELKLKYKRPLHKFYQASKGPLHAFVILNADSNEIDEYFGAPEGVQDAIVKILSERERLSVAAPVIHDPYFETFELLKEGMSVVDQCNLAVENLLECLEIACKNPASKNLPVKNTMALNISMEDGEGAKQDALIGIRNGKVFCGRPKKDFKTIKVSRMKCASLIFGPVKPSVLLGDNSLAWLDLVLPIPVHVPSLYHV